MLSVMGPGGRVRRRLIIRRRAGRRRYRTGSSATVNAHTKQSFLKLLGKWKTYVLVFPRYFSTLAGSDWLFSNSSRDIPSSGLACVLYLQKYQFHLLGWLTGVSLGVLSFVSGISPHFQSVIFSSCWTSNINNAPNTILTVSSCLCLSISESDIAPSAIKSASLPSMSEWDGDETVDEFRDDSASLSLSWNSKHVETTLR